MLYPLYEWRLVRALDFTKTPHHVGVILDGNRRWAKANPSNSDPNGHKAGANKIIEFLDKEKEIYDLAALEDAKREKPLPRYFEMDKRIRYKVRKGDFLGKIANKFGVRISDIKRWNRLKSSRLSIGQRLYIYPKKVSFSSIDRPQNKRHESTLTAICERDMMQQGALNGEIYQKITDVSDPKFIKWNDLWRDRKGSFETALKISKS